MSMYQTLISTPFDDMCQIISKAKSRTEVLLQFGFKGNDPRARKYITSFILENDVPIDHFTERQYRERRQYSIVDVKRAVKTATCMAEVLRTLGLSEVGGNSVTIKSIIANNDIDISHFNRQRNATQAKYGPGDVFVENCKISRTVVRRWVLREGVVEYKCAKCNNDGEWCGDTITLELDHINGNRLDNRLENLRFLCPNCHSQTSTFRGKNKNNYSSE